MTLEWKAFTCSYLATAGSVRIARRAGEAVVLGWGLSQRLADDVGLVVSELFTNAVKEAPHGEVRVRIAGDACGTVTVEVWDRSSKHPVRKQAQPTDPGGRGLEIVEILSTRCGSRPDGNGKTVFAVIAIT